MNPCKRLSMHIRDCSCKISLRSLPQTTPSSTCTVLLHPGRPPSSESFIATGQPPPWQHGSTRALRPSLDADRRCKPGAGSAVAGRPGQPGPFDAHPGKVGEPHYCCDSGMAGTPAAATGSTLSPPPPTHAGGRLAAAGGRTPACVTAAAASGTAAAIAGPAAAGEQPWHHRRAVIASHGGFSPVPFDADPGPIDSDPAAATVT